MAEGGGRKTLSRIKSGAWSRGLSLARVSLSAGGKAAGYALGGLFADASEGDSRLKALLTAQAELLSKELGQLKGSLMKAGQLLSMYGEQILPPEANALLKSLQSESPPLAWREMEKVLRRQLSPERLAELEISKEPLGSASLGQVHLATRLSDGRKIALKIQYPGVDQAIESDLAAMRRLLTVTRLLPKGAQGTSYDELFAEVRQMLRQEVDYRRELTTTDGFRAMLADDPRFVVPETFPEYSSGRVLATSFEEGVGVDGAEVRGLSQERRDALGAAAFELYLRELLVWRKVQTDPHFGNYRVRLGQGAAPDRLVLLDFGAVREFTLSFIRSYARMMRGALDHDPSEVFQGARGLGFLHDGDSEESRLAFAELCYLAAEPFAGGAYAWGESDLPKRAMKAGKELAFRFRLRPPPREVVFLDRKLGGVFVFLATIGARLDGGPILRRYLDGLELS